MIINHFLLFPIAINRISVKPRLLQIFFVRWSRWLLQVNFCNLRQKRFKKLRALKKKVFKLLSCFSSIVTTQIEVQTNTVSNWLNQRKKLIVGLVDMKSDSEHKSVRENSSLIILKCARNCVWSDSNWLEIVSDQTPMQSKFSMTKFKCARRWSDQRSLQSGHFWETPLSVRYKTTNGSDSVRRA